MVLEIALLFRLTNLFLGFQFRKQPIQLLKTLPFALAFLGVVGLHLLIYVGMKQSFIWLSNQDDSIGFWHLLLSLSVGVVLGLVIVGMQYLIFYFRREQQISLEIEKAEKAKTDAQLLSLQQQLNPHFMFNNFNTLHGLIHENPAEASEFLLELSDLYRGILAVTQEELIPLKQEMELVNHFNFLLNKRLGKSYQCEIELDKKTLDTYFVPPLSVQLLLENVVKHNKMSNEEPIKCRIWKEGENLVVENNLQPKKNAENSNGIGLKNLKRRYSFLTQKEFIAKQSENLFTVQLPLLQST